MHREGKSYRDQWGDVEGLKRTDDQLLDLEVLHGVGGGGLGVSLSETTDEGGGEREGNGTIVSMSRPVVYTASREKCDSARALVVGLSAVPPVQSHTSFMTPPSNCPLQKSVASQPWLG